MGFEENLEKGLRDKHQGKAVQHFAKGGTPEQIGRNIRATLCSALRDMEA